ncbi:cobalt-zinc-cadmium resistance protein [Psychromonas marina]|uniref:Cobalt-zinc-cadmium resistance protein n=1 Tax=Psychromonas marina TaxID=88364 RepID=A0ABQ6E369_9GAMM|nr:cation transporter [Psychromonas marina]GLS91859.1 cobalt-zinc-cadmium resistance protein [Psychromonas marina]
MGSSVSKERGLLKFSIFMGVVYSVIGITWGLILQSGIILFDAIYSGIAILLSIMTIYALGIVTSDESFDTAGIAKTKFQMGKTSVEPLVISIKSIVIISICLYGFVDAVSSLISGGSTQDNAFAGILYGVITSIVCICSWLYLKVAGKDSPDLVQAESEQWLVDTLFSVLVIFSFALSYMLAQTSFSYMSPYIDPLSVVLATVYFVQIPGKRLIHSVKELLLMAPNEQIQAKINEAILQVKDEHQLDSYIVRSTKTGRQLNIEIAFVIVDPKRTFEVGDLDKIRSEVERSLQSFGMSLWLNIIFTQDRHWA